MKPAFILPPARLLQYCQHVSVCIRYINGHLLEVLTKVDVVLSELSALGSMVLVLKSTKISAFPFIGIAKTILPNMKASKSVQAVFKDFTSASDALDHGIHVVLFKICQKKNMFSKNEFFPNKRL